MKKLLHIIIASAVVMSLILSAFAADLSTVLPAVNAGEADALDGYSFDNPLSGWAVPDELRIEFDLIASESINPYASIFCFHNDDSNGRVAFTMAGGLFFNNWSGYWFDAGLHNGVHNNIFEPHIGSSVHVKLEFDYDTFGVYLNDELAYDSSTFKNDLDSAGAFYGEGLTDEYLTIITYIFMRESLSFGYNSWWVSSQDDVSDVTNADISNFKIYCDDKLAISFFNDGEVGANEIYDESDYESPDVTDTEPVANDDATTEMPDTEPPVPQETTPESEAPEEKSGCGSAAGGFAVFITTAAAALGCTVIKRKRK